VSANCNNLADTDLKSSIQCSLYCNTLTRVCPIGCDSCYQAVQFISLFLCINIACHQSQNCSQRVMKMKGFNQHTFSFLTRLSMARLEKLSLSPPWRWHIKLCTMLRQASALVGLLLLLVIPRPNYLSAPEISCAICKSIRSLKIDK